METSHGYIDLQLPDGSTQQFAISKLQVTLGRGLTNDIVLQDTKISRSHACINFDGKGGISVSDLGSTNGTYINNQRISQAVVAPGQTVRLGDCVLSFEPASVPDDGSMTTIESETDLDRTLMRPILPVSLNETGVDRLVIHTPDRTWEVRLDDRVDVLTVGRAPDCDIVLENPSISRQHARITREHLTVKINDLNSRNGIWLGGQKIEETVFEDGVAVRIGYAHIVYKRAFREEHLTIAGTSFKIPARKVPVVFVPGIMGSELWLGSERIWPNLKLLFQRPDLLMYPGDPRMQPRGILQEVVVVPNVIKLDQYNRLGDYLVQDLGYERGKDFFEFAYDWRQDVRLSARQLGMFIDALPVKQPIKIIAHSLGTLVTRSYVALYGGKDKVERIVLMGGPHFGTPAGASSLIFGPSLLPFGVMGESLRKVIATFPTAYQILPVYACGADQFGQPYNFIKESGWLSPQQRPLWQLAREFKKQLGVGLGAPTTCIFGYGLGTVDKISVVRQPDGSITSAKHLSGQNGDDSVPQNSAILEGADIHPVQQHHGALFTDNDVKMRLRLELIGKPFI